ncbi:hypothetical protein FO131_19760 [Salmonella bongori]|uniref:hypothetical protein n=1 Tax=Salmonella bongori TaxID=54736 RepID=UPI001288C01E|nr:hypothetical protein [Salmonella bongori]ECG8260410.1 hypothetical protein [Salmonella bongori serovar 48:i:-]ECG9254742.1 hypothetical protein [Salmonella bongori]EDP8708210.1 hypothetical protein [Salmonella bongori]EDP8725830.1 hypothetical protein [Salmonella bongori]EEO9371587.1 hypothetical protein [Salmonella bongori]
MVISILDERSNVVSIIPSCIPHESAITAAQALVREAAHDGRTLAAVNEDGENILSPTISIPEKNPDLKFNGYVTDPHDEELAEFSGVYVF